MPREEPVISATLPDRSIGTDTLIPYQLVAVEVIVYSRMNCHLCDLVKEVIEAARRRHRLDIVVNEIDIDQHPELRERFDWRVPVVSIAGREVFEYRVDQQSFVAAVERAAETMSR